MFRFQGIELPDRKQYMDSLATLTIDGALADELRPYLQADLDRFLYTIALVPEGKGRALEIGANPYFTTALMQMLRPGYQMDLVNYFGEIGLKGVQHVRWRGLSDEQRSIVADYHNVNVEASALPFPDNTFDLVLFCEVLEHFTTDPLHALQEISRVLKPGGQLILTTPNVNRIGNVIAMVTGLNIYDPYSGHGPHGRHNREYSRHELYQLLTHAGFEAEIHFTSDVSDPPRYENIDGVMAMLSTVPGREHDLGAYLFSRWNKANPVNSRLPRWLYRSYPEALMA